MRRREVAELAVYQTKEEIDVLLLEKLRNLYINKTSEIIYITKACKLYGIVCLGDILKNVSDGKVKINKNFISLKENSIIEAKDIFKKKKNINKIPIVDEDGELVGDYTRWEDDFYIERNQNRYLNSKIAKRMLSNYKNVYVVEPIEIYTTAYLRLLSFLENIHVDYRIVNKERVNEMIADQTLFIYFNEDERRGVQCLYGFVIDQYEELCGFEEKVRFTTYRNLMSIIFWETELKDLNLQKPNIMPYNRIDEKTSVLFSQLRNRGIKCFCLYSDEREKTEYAKKFFQKVYERISKYPINQEEQWPHKGEDDEFYDELYQIEDYKNEVAQKEIDLAWSTFQYKKDIQGKYFNSKEGRRITCFQPESYIGTIYFFGPCTVVGSFVEDQYTIESYLQKKLLEKGYVYRVENYGAVLRLDSEIDSKLQEIEFYHPNDIVIMLSKTGEVLGVPGISLEKIFEKNQIPSEWVMNAHHFYHCNHKANKVIADSVLEMIEPVLDSKREICREDIQIDFHKIMQDYIYNKYLKQYFESFIVEKYDKIGAIVMNCNPFSKGHRYLIEQARKYVDFLIVFVVEEDVSLFSFEERFIMIVEGTREFDNIMIVPSGEFVLSMNTFSEYFRKVNSAAITINAEYDINIFADYIAPLLNITYRFAGEEPYDPITRVYNETMRKILPSKGIRFVEIPRIAENNEIISASRIRKHLENGEYEEVYNLVPKTTAKYLK